MAKSDRVGKKIGKLAKEGKPPKQAQAIALNMAREGKLTKSGGYDPAGGYDRIDRGGHRRRGR